MGLVKIKHPEVHALGEILAENLTFWEARGWSLFDEQAEPPKPTARKSVWVDFAVAQGADEDTADDMTRAQLVDLYGTPPDLEVVDPTAVPDNTTDEEQD